MAMPEPATPGDEVVAHHERDLRAQKIDGGCPVVADRGVEIGGAPYRRGVAARGFGARRGHGERLGGVSGRQAGGQHDPVGELAGEPEHLRAHRRDVERNRFGRPERHPHAVEAEHLALVSARLARPELAQAGDELAHRDERPFQLRTGLGQKHRVAGAQASAARLGAASAMVAIAIATETGDQR